MKNAIVIINFKKNLILKKIYLDEKKKSKKKSTLKKQNKNEY